MVAGLAGGQLPLLPHPRRVDLGGEAALRWSGQLRTVEDPRLPRQGYRIAIHPEEGVTLAASEPSGFFYGRATLDQLRRVFTPGPIAARADGGSAQWTGAALLPVGTIEDWPDLEVRGVMLDVSRNKVPTLDTLFDLVDRLASWKLNHLQLYTEHTYAYSRHEEVWQDADPYDAEDMRRLADHCAERHVELVPNQNTLGHMERWLMHDRYAHLGIERGVVMGPFGMPVPASTLDPANPGSLALVRELVEELASAIPASRFHVGLDEPWQLPRRRHAEWAGWAGALSAAPEMRGREVLVWGDLLATYPEMLGAVSESLTVCEWGYESNHPFDRRGEALATAGLRHWLCPGTSSWMSVLGRATNALDNCRSAATSAAGSGAAGLMVTDWGDFGHLQYPPVSDPGLAAAAAFSWCTASNEHLDAKGVGSLLSLHSFTDTSGSIGDAVVALGDVHRILPTQLPNMSSLVANLYLPQLPAGRGITEFLEISHLEEVEAALDEAASLLARADPAGTHGRCSIPELRNSMSLVRLCCDDLRVRLESGERGSLAEVPEQARRALASRLADIVTEHRALWLTRNRHGGLDESCAWLDHLEGCYLEGEAERDWAGPLVASIRSGRDGGSR
jgi:hexosaminidase